MPCATTTNASWSTPATADTCSLSDLPGSGRSDVIGASAPVSEVASTRPSRESTCSTTSPYPRPDGTTWSMGRVVSWSASWEAWKSAWLRAVRVRVSSKTATTTQAQSARVTTRIAMATPSTRVRIPAPDEVAFIAGLSRRMCRRANR